jgi:hypothetical protein
MKFSRILCVCVISQLVALLGGCVSLVNKRQELSHVERQFPVTGTESRMVQAHLLGQDPMKVLSASERMLQVGTSEYCPNFIKQGEEQIKSKKLDKNDEVELFGTAAGKLKLGVAIERCQKLLATMSSKTITSCFKRDIFNVLVLSGGKWVVKDDYDWDGAYEPYEISCDEMPKSSDPGEYKGTPDAKKVEKICSQRNGRFKFGAVTTLEKNYKSYKNNRFVCWWQEKKNYSDK